MSYTKALVVNTGDDSLNLKGLNSKNQMEKIYLSKLMGTNKKMGPYDISMGKKGYIYIVNSYDDSLIKVDLEKRILLDILQVGRFPTCIETFQKKIYIANSDSNSISIIDEESFSLIEDVFVGEKPESLLVDKRNLKLFISNTNSHSISVLDLKDSSISTIKLEKQPVKMIMEDNRLFLLSYINNGITNYSNLSEIEVKNFSTIMSIDLKGIYMDLVKIKGVDVFYLLNVDNGYMYRICLKNGRNVSKIYLGGMPNNIIFDGEDKLYITNGLKNTLTVVWESDNNIIYNIRVGKEPNRVLLL